MSLVTDTGIYGLAPHLHAAGSRASGGVGRNPRCRWRPSMKLEVPFHLDDSGTSEAGSDTCYSEHLRRTGHYINPWL